jgi:hypothetical protein
MSQRKLRLYSTSLLVCWISIKLVPPNHTNKERKSTSYKATLYTLTRKYSIYIPSSSAFSTSERWNKPPHPPISKTLFLRPSNMSISLLCSSITYRMFTKPYSGRSKNYYEKGIMKQELV